MGTSGTSPRGRPEAPLLFESVMDPVQICHQRRVLFLRQGGYRFLNVIGQDGIEHGGKTFLRVGPDAATAQATASERGLNGQILFHEQVCRAPARTRLPYRNTGIQRQDRRRRNTDVAQLLPDTLDFVAILDV